MELLEKYESVIDGLSDRNKRNVHYKSLKNYIIHLQNLTSNRTYVEIKIDEYLELVNDEKGDITEEMSTFLLEKYIMVIGEEYVQIGFVHITPLKYLLLFSLMGDSLSYIAFFNFPYPIITAFTLAYYFLYRKKWYDKNKAFGMFY